MKKIFRYLGYLIYCSRWILKSLASRLLFGSSISMRNNLDYLFKRRRFNRKGRLFQTSAVFLEDFLSRDEAESLSQRFENLLLQEDVRVSSPNEYQIFIRNPEQNFHFTSTLLERIHSELANYYRKPFVCHRLRAWRNLPLKSTEDMSPYIYSNYWHQDDLRCDTIKVFLYLSDATGEQDGGTWVLDKKLSRKFIRNWKFLHTSINGGTFTNFLQKLGIRYELRPSKGAAFFFNSTNALHCSSLVRGNKPRDVLQFEYVLSDISKKPFDPKSMEPDSEVLGYA